MAISPAASSEYASSIAEISTGQKEFTNLNALTIQILESVLSWYQTKDKDFVAEFDIL